MPCLQRLSATWVRIGKIENGSDDMTRWNTSNKNPYEEDEQIKLAQYLDMKNYCWCHVPNEGKHKVQYYAKQTRMGVKSGVPDILIFNSCKESNSKHFNAYKGIAIELKRKKGGRVSKEQKEWLNKLDNRGWLTRVCKGADEAIDWLESLK